MPNHGIAYVHYSENGVPIGTRRSYCCGASDSGQSFSAYWPHTAYFCPICGELWAREVFDHQFDYQPRPMDRWVTETRKCLAHGDGQLLVGKPLEGCSDDLVKREFQILLHLYEKEYPNASETNY